MRGMWCAARWGPGRLVGFAALALALPGLGAGSTVLYQTLPEMAVAADQILIGEVVGMRAQVAVRRNSIHTFVTIEVDEFLKGERRGRRMVTLRILGGEAEGYRLVVPGSPRFELGERVLVFSEGAAGRIPGVLGLAAGKFSLDQDPRTGEPTLRRSLLGLTLRSRDGADVPHESASPRGRVSLEEVRALVRSALRPI